MLVTITPIGSAPADVGAAAAAYVDYLCGGSSAATEASVPSPTGDLDDGGGVVGYYTNGESADGFGNLDGAGWWSGGGAALLELGDTVDRNDFSALLQGRNAMTGERLVSAQGSTGRVHLKAGKPTRLIAGQPVWSHRDASIALGRSIGVGSVDESELVAFDGELFVSLAGMQKLLVDAGEFKAKPTLEEVSAGDGSVAAAEVARAVDVTTRHMTKVCSDIVSGELKDTWGLSPTMTGGRWFVERSGVTAWNADRTPAAVRVAYDATLTTEKSFSVFALTVPGALETSLDALTKSNAAALKWLEQSASTGRKRGERVASHGHAVASFMHSTSRNDDPFLHCHNVVLNAIVDEDGVGRTLDATGLYAQGPAAAALATATMRRHLTEHLGVDWRLSGRDTWEIDGIDDVVLEGFSSRTAEIEAAVAELLEAPDRAGVDALKKSTRQAKTGKSARELIGDWDNRADQLGFGSPQRQAVLGKRVLGTGPLKAAERESLWRWLDSPSGVCASSSTARLGDVLWSITNWAPHGRLAVLSPDQILTEAQRWLESKHVVLMDPVRKVGAAGLRIGAAAEPAWTTTTMISLQAAIRNSWNAGRLNHTNPNDGHLVDRGHLQEAIDAASVALSGEQIELVTNWVSSGHQIQAALGRPGTGKTTAMRTAAHAWTSQGIDVAGAAVKGEAARLLGEEAEISANTVAWYLAKWRSGTNPLNNNTVLIVDEASTLSDWDLGGLIAMTIEAGASLRLIGDPAQHGSVEAGGSWAAMLAAFPVDAPELKHQRRLQNPIEAQVAELVRSHDFDEALKMLDEAGGVERFETFQQAAVPLVHRWWKARLNGDGHPLVERTNSRRTMLNTLAQQMRLSVGEVTAPELVGTKRFGIGDEIIAKEPNRNATNAAGDHIRNGSAGTITAIGSKTITVDFDALGPIDVPVEFAGRPAGIDLAYSLTSYAVQGATNNASTSVISDGVSAAELLVNLTRGRHENVLYAVGDDNELTPPAPPELNELATNVRTKVSEPAASIDADVDAIAAHRLLGQRLSAHDRTDETKAGRRARDQRAHALALKARLNTVPEPIIAVVGERPANPIRAEKWERLVVDVLQHWDQHRPVPLKTKDAVANLLGKVPAPDRAARAALKHRIDGYVGADIEVGL